MNQAAVWMAALLLGLSAVYGPDGSAFAQQVPGGRDLDARVSRFLSDTRRISQ